MSYIFVVMGKSASGKDTIYKRLADELKLRTVVSYTTRPIREGEKNGQEYYFVTKDQFEEKLQSNQVIESRTYDTVYGKWTYFTLQDHQIDLSHNDYIMIGTLESFEQIQQYYGNEAVVPIYIEVENGLRLERALKREKNQSYPKYEEMCRRFLADEEDFAESKINALNIRHRYENIELCSCIENIKKELCRMGIEER